MALLVFSTRPLTTFGDKLQLATLADALSFTAPARSLSPFATRSHRSRLGDLRTLAFPSLFGVTSLARRRDYRPLEARALSCALREKMGRPPFVGQSADTFLKSAPADTLDAVRDNNAPQQARERSPFPRAGHENAGPAQLPSFMISTTRRSAHATRKTRRSSSCCPRASYWDGAEARIARIAGAHRCVSINFTELTTVRTSAGRTDDTGDSDAGVGSLFPTYRSQ